MTAQGNNWKTTLAFFILSFAFVWPAFVDGHILIGLVISVNVFLAGFCSFQYLQTGKLLPTRKK